MESRRNVRGLYLLYCLSCTVAIILVILMGVWLMLYKGGFAWQSNPNLEFNWHPILMTIGLIVLYGNGMVTYRLMRDERKKKLKLIHASLMMGAFVFAVVGLKAVFDSHDLKNPPIPNLYTLHSWAGILTVILFAMQWFCGFVSFLIPGLRQPLRAAYLPFHVFFGAGIFVLACATALMGLLEKAIFSLGKDYPTAGEGVLMNVMGILIIVFGFIIIIIVTQPKWKRHPIPEDELLLSDRLSERSHMAVVTDDQLKFSIAIGSSSPRSSPGKSPIAF